MIFLNILDEAILNPTPDNGLNRYSITKQYFYDHRNIDSTVKDKTNFGSLNTSKDESKLLQRIILNFLF